MFFFLKNNKVFLKKDFEILPEIIALEKKFSKNPERLEKIYDYLHFVYYKKSTYIRTVLCDRQEMVCIDRFNNKDLWKTIESVKEVKDVIEKMNIMQFTENEALFNDVRLKISEYITVLRSEKVTIENAKEMRDLIGTSQDMLKLRKQLQEMVYEDMKHQNSNEENGAGLFEDDN